MSQPPDPIAHWAATHPADAVSRIIGRLEKFSNNTSNEETSLAGQELVRILRLREEQLRASQTQDDS